MVIVTNLHIDKINLDIVSYFFGICVFFFFVFDIIKGRFVTI